MASSPELPGTAVIVSTDHALVQLQDYENGLLEVLRNHGLPTEAIFVSIDERSTVFRNMSEVISRVQEEQRGRSIYISKFVAAAAAGLFDAALNYLWDETISELRRRVAHYDISYFFDSAVSSPEKRKRLSSEEDLSKIDDSELILGAQEIGLISDVGYKHLDYIRYMRNYASAAHPNQNELTGLQIMSWLDTCIRQVISLPLSQSAIGIRQLLANIKSKVLSEEEAKQIGVFFLDLTQEQVNNLAGGFFGIYTRLETTTQTRQNVHHLLPLLWDRVDEITRQEFGMKYSRFVGNNDQEETKLSRQFLQLVGGTSYIPPNLRVLEIESAIDNLVTAHRGFNNLGLTQLSEAGGNG